jgi:hypothetical protein
MTQQVMLTPPQNTALLNTTPAPKPQTSAVIRTNWR